MLNLDTLGGISFSKGCYTGQEVVARLHYLGQLKRRMFLLYADDIAQAVAGGPIHRHGGDDQAVGEVVAVQRHPVHG
ncbi:tRNA-modifying protein YgfZ, partial [Klebsiella pneumoniae]